MTPEQRTSAIRDLCGLLNGLDYIIQKALPLFDAIPKEEQKPEGIRLEKALRTVTKIINSAPEKKQ